MSYKEIAAAASMLIGLYSIIVYVRSVLKGETKPHLFSWLVWSTVMGIAAAIQYTEGAGVGAFVTFFSSFLCFWVVVLSFKYGEKRITNSDWFFLISSLSIIPLWIMTQNALIAAVLATLIDDLAAVPTFRKSYLKPYEENMYVFFIGGVCSALSIVAVESYSIATALYPVAITITNFAMVIMLAVRRRSVRVTK